MRCRLKYVGGSMDARRMDRLDDSHITLMLEHRAAQALVAGELLPDVPIA